MMLIDLSQWDSPLYVHVVVVPSSIPDVAFESRIYTPITGFPEDLMCGTAHTLYVKFWTSTMGLSGGD